MRSTFGLRGYPRLSARRISPRPNPHALSRGQITIHLIELYKSLGGGLAYE